MIWGRLPAHRSWLVQEFLRASQGRIEQVWLPGLRAGVESGRVRVGLLEAA